MIKLYLLHLFSDAPVVVVGRPIFMLSGVREKDEIHHLQKQLMIMGANHHITLSGGHVLLKELKEEVQKY